MCAACFEAVNRSKKSVTLDLEKPDDIAKFHKLLETADVLLTNVLLPSLERQELVLPNIAIAV